MLVGVLAVLLLILLSANVPEKTHVGDLEESLQPGVALPIVII